MLKARLLLGRHRAKSRPRMQKYDTTERMWRASNLYERISPDPRAVQRAMDRTHQTLAY